MDTLAHFISVATLASRLGKSSQPVIIDCRREKTFASAETLIAGATWRDPFLVDEWINYLPRHRDIVVYCVHGHEISKNVCAALRAAHINAYTLEGGIVAWQDAAQLTLKKNPALTIPSAINAPSRWITRERPKIDRIACPWLIRRFVDPFAEFLYVPSSEVLHEAARQNAIAYDVPGVTFSHRGQLGERCSFDAFMDDFELHNAALNALANIVRGADTGKPELTSQSSGLLAVSLGLSQLYENDIEMLEHGMIIYDALYAWLNTAQAEIHNADIFKAAS
jgi:rhodanese-related sulfurtransferase